MNDEEGAFIGAMSQFLGTYGMTPMAGRLWGYLLICDPPEQTAEQVARALHASRGAISGAVRLLEPIGFIQRMRRHADRREYLSAPPGTFLAFVAGAGPIYRRLRLIIEQGLAAVADQPPAVRTRLEEAHEFMVYVEREIPAVLDRFVRERATATEPALSADLPTPSVSSDATQEGVA